MSDYKNLRVWGCLKKASSDGVLNGVDLRILIFLCEQLRSNPAVSVSYPEIFESCSCSRSKTVEGIGRLIERGYIVKRCAHDGISPNSYELAPQTSEVAA